MLADGLFDEVLIAVDAASVYWTSQGDGTVVKVPKNGGARATLATMQESPLGIAVEGSAIYWGNGTGELMKAALDGSDPVALVSERTDLIGVAVDSTSVYWTEDAGNVMQLTPTCACP